MAKKKVVKSRVEKPYNSGTLSKAGFWSMIRSSLRQTSRWWKPIAECKTNARRKNISSNKALKWQYQCNSCKEWFTDKEVIVDHIIEAGTLTKKEDVGDFIERLFCEKEGFQVLCNKRLDGAESCHKIKTDNYMASRRTLRS